MRVPVKNPIDETLENQSKADRLISSPRQKLNLLLTLAEQLVRSDAQVLSYEQVLPSLECDISNFKIFFDMYTEAITANIALNFRLTRLIQHISEFPMLHDILQHMPVIQTVVKEVIVSKKAIIERIPRATSILQRETRDLAMLIPVQQKLARIAETNPRVLAHLYPLQRAPGQETSYLEGIKEFLGFFTSQPEHVLLLILVLITVMTTVTSTNDTVRTAPKPR